MKHLNRFNDMENPLTNTPIERKVKRLQIAVVALGILFVLSICVSIYSAMQIRMVANNLPSYKEIKEDIKTLNSIYCVSKVEVPKAYNYTKEKANVAKEKINVAYEYSKEKTNSIISYFKEKKK